MAGKLSAFGKHTMSNNKIQLGGVGIGGTMAEILAENLSGKAVMGSDGAELGMLYNITMDLETGRLDSLVITPEEGTDPTEFERDAEGRALVPVERVQAVKDHMIIER